MADDDERRSYSSGGEALPGDAGEMLDLLIRKETARRVGLSVKLLDDIRAAVLPVPHVCSCGHGEGGCAVAPFDDRCRFEMLLRQLVEEVG